MNYLVFLDTHAGELEKILSGVKSMIVKEFDPTLPTVQHVKPGDNLYFLRDNDESDLRVKATVVGVWVAKNLPNEDLSHVLKEMQPRLQLTEDQYNYWSTRNQALLFEFKFAHKIEMIQISSNRIADRLDWIAFEDFSQIG